MFSFRKRKPDLESVQALKEANETLRQAKARGPEVREVAAALRTMRTRNHFAETLQVIMEGHR